MFRRKDSWLETLNIQTLQKEIFFFNHAEADWYTSSQIQKYEGDNGRLWNGK